MSSKVTSVKDQDDTVIPEKHILLQCYPSPYSKNSNYNGVTFVFEFPSEWGQSLVNLSIYNTLGQKVRELLNQPLSPGRHEIFWDVLDEFSQSVPTGVYFYSVQVSDRKPETNRIIIFKYTLWENSCTCSSTNLLYIGFMKYIMLLFH